MLGITKISRGRMGNRLFHYHFLRQISEKTGIDYFHTAFPESAYFEEMDTKRRPLWPWRRAMRLTSKDVLKYNCEDFLGLVAEEAAKGRDIIFKPPMLGEVFFDYLFCDPNQFLRVKPAFRREFAFERANRTVIGIHFRGTDFPAWNHHAALNFPYYRAAIEFCLEEFEAEKPLFVLFTDDNKYPAYSETVAFLQSLGEKCCFGDAAGLPIHDFYQMSQCDVLVSSPSTFAIWAGCLGKQKRIIHDKAWLEYAVTRNDTFWVRSATRATSYYTIWKTF